MLENKTESNLQRVLSVISTGTCAFHSWYGKESNYRKQSIGVTESKEKESGASIKKYKL
jgi:hypothetical protein